MSNAALLIAVFTKLAGEILLGTILTLAALSFLLGVFIITERISSNRVVITSRRKDRHGGLYR